MKQQEKGDERLFFFVGCPAGGIFLYKTSFSPFFAHFQNTVLYKIGSTITKCKNEIKIRLIFFAARCRQKSGFPDGEFFRNIFRKYMLRKVF